MDGLTDTCLCRLDSVAGVGELVLDPLEAVAEGGLELALDGEGVVGGDAPLPLQLGVGRAGEALALPARAVETVRVGEVLVAESAAGDGGVIGGGGIR